MNYSFKSDIKASDFWVLTMIQTYKAWTGIVNVIFTLAMFGLTIRFFSTEHPIRNFFLILGCSIFIVIQPLCMYLFAMKQVESVPKDMNLSFDSSGVHVTTMSNHQNIPWKKVSRVVKAKNMIILYTAGQSGYMITDRVLAEKKDEFYNFCVDNMKRAK